MSRALIAFYFLVLLTTLLVSTRTVQGPWLFLFRAFFPNWKFYHSLGWQPQLYVRVRGVRARTKTPALTKEVLGDQMVHPNHVDSVESVGDWSLCVLVYPRAKRDLLNLFHNPDVNIALAHQNLVEHLANDLQQLSEQVDPKSLVSYQLVNRFVRFWIGNHFQPIQDQALEYQFEIRLSLNSPQIKARMLEQRRLELRKLERMQDEGALAVLPLEDEMHVLMISPVMKLEDKAPLHDSGEARGLDRSVVDDSTQNFEGTTQNIPTAQSTQTHPSPQSTEFAAQNLANISHLNPTNPTSPITQMNKSSAWSLLVRPKTRLQALLFERGQP